MINQRSLLNPGWVGARLPYPGAHVTRTVRPAAVLAALLPFVGPHAYGQACNNQILPGGASCAATVSAGSTVTNTTINAGGVQKVKGGTTQSIVNSGGSQTVSSGGVATGTVLNPAGVQIVYSRGSTLGTVISGGTQYVSAGGTAVNTIVNSGGSFGVSNGGLAVNAVVSSGGLQRVYSGGSASGTTVAGGKQYVSAGGSASGTTVNGGFQVVYTRGAATGTVVNMSGNQTVSSGGKATGASINNGGTQFVLLGGSAANTTVAAGGTMVVNAGGTTASGTVAALPVSGITLAGTLSVIESPGDGLRGAAAATLNGLAINGGTVTLGAPGTGGYKTLTVNGLSGNGQFVLNTNIGAMQSDQLVVNQGSGRFVLSVHDSSVTAPTGPGERLLLVNATNSTATFSLAGSTMDVGAYKFGLQDSGSQYYLYNTGRESDIASVVQAAASVPTMLWYQQLEQTFAHLADYRDGAADGQFWVRSYDERMRTSPGDTSTTTDFYGVQAGRDWRISSALGDFHVGATGGFAQASEDFDPVGNGTARPWNLGAYGGFNGFGGIFADAVVRYLGMKQEASVSSAANPASAGYDLSGYSASIDGGKRWQLGSHWWVEPRVELTYQRSGSVEYQTTFGTLVGLEATNMVIGSAGATVGASLAVGQITLAPFLSIAGTHVFNGNVSDTVGGTLLTTSVPQTWVVANAGVSAALSRRVRVYGAFEYGKGRDYTQPWAVTVGLSYVD